MDDATRYSLYALIVALLAPGVAALWKAASLRGDISEKWNNRVDVTFAGLSERAVQELFALRTEINDLLIGSADGDFDPLKVVVDPSKLSGHVSKFQKCIQVRSKLRKRFEHLLKLGPIAVGIVGVYLIGVATVAAYYTELYRHWWLGRAGIILSSADIVAGMAVIADYAYLQHRLSSAEILSGEEME